MRTMLLATLVAALLVGLAKAQEAAGETAEQVTKAILKLEVEKVKAVQSTVGSSPYMADWFDHVMVNEVAYTGADGKVLTKAQWIDGWRSPQHKMLSIHQFDHRVKVYGDGGDGTTVVVTFINDVSREVGRKQDSLHSRATDVWVKMDAAWRVVAVHITPVQHEKKN